jgi:hypothetical protein
MTCTLRTPRGRSVLPRVTATSIRAPDSSLTTLSATPCAKVSIVVQAVNRRIWIFFIGGVPYSFFFLIFTFAV